MAAIVRYAWSVLVLNIGVILMGAVVRATGSGAGCGPSWPTCQGELIPELVGATSIEFAHRALSGVALVMVLALAIWVWRHTAAHAPARTGATLAVVAIVVEALIGAMIVLAEWVANDASAARAFAVPLHLVNTLFLLGALTLTIFWLSGGGRLDWSVRRGVTRVVIIGGVALVLLSATGAITALADTLFPKGGGDLTSAAHFLTRLRIVHPILAVTAASAGWWVAGRGRLPRGRPARALPILVGLMLVTGALNIALGVPVVIQVIHLALADVLWVAYVLTSAGALAVPAPVSISS
ncbi:MAG TPA: COX15/CtaA family protein [Acidimicrobiia bacterium]